MCSGGDLEGQQIAQGTTEFLQGWTVKQLNGYTTVSSGGPRRGGGQGGHDPAPFGAGESTI